LTLDCLVDGIHVGGEIFVEAINCFWVDSLVDGIVSEWPGLVLVVLHVLVHETEVHSNDFCSLVGLRWDSWEAKGFDCCPFGEAETQVLKANFEVTEVDLFLEILHCVLVHVA